MQTLVRELDLDNRLLDNIWVEEDLLQEEIVLSEEDHIQDLLQVITNEEENILDNEIENIVIINKVEEEIDLDQDKRNIKKKDKADKILQENEIGDKR